jgi:hypothetical protein
LARSSAAHLVLTLALAATVLVIGVASASALVLRLHNGRTISYRPVSGALAPSPFASRARSKARLLEYHGGPIMPSNTNYAVYWDPEGGPAYPAEYQSGLNTYFKDLAHDSGGLQNVDSVATQYSDSASQFANYNSKFGGALIDTDPYPVSGCAAAVTCFTDEQLQAELKAYVEKNKLPHNITTEYFLLTPPGVEDCAETTACSAGSSLPVYCAYHSFIPMGGGSIIYANDPYVTGIEGCDNGEHPNNKPSDGALEGGLSHEHNESITDPEINAWFDSKGEENGDKCRTFEEASEYGTPLGKAKDGSKYNQVINGDLYWYQQEWSNEGARCEQRLEKAPPTVTRVSPKRGRASEETPVTISGSGFSEATAVTFGGVGAKFKVLSPVAIQAFSPPHPRGTVDVIVSTPAGSSAATKKDRFKYVK